MAKAPTQPTVEGPTVAGPMQGSYEQALEKGEQHWDQFLPTQMEPRRQMLLALISAEVTKRQRTGDQLPIDRWSQEYPEIGPELKILTTQNQANADTKLETSKTAGLADEGVRESNDVNAGTAATMVGEANTFANVAGGSRIETSSALRKVGTYELLEKLGEGGMGAVYKARHTKLGRIMAVKILSHRALNDANAIARFEREMLAVGRIHHPNIVQAFDAGEADGVHYLAMEYVEGKDLQAYLDEKGPLSVVNACKVIQQAARGMSAAHALGLVHRDLKPGNLFVTKTGQVKVLDLGLALVPSSENQKALTSHGSWFGTPDYMAPEQWESSHDVDARADLYALGCTLFCLLVGRPPYATEVNSTVASKMIAHSVNESPDLLSARPGIPKELATLFKRLVAKKPEDRLASAQELVEQLNPFVTKQTVISNENKTHHLETKVSSNLATIVPSHTATQAAGVRQPPKNRWRTATAAAGGAAALLMLGAIVITIVNKDGTQSKIRIAEDVEVDVQVAPGSKVTLTQESEGAEPLRAGWHGWPADAPAPAISPFDAKQAQQHQENWAKYLGVPVEYTNSIGMKFRLIPPGEFTMGTSATTIETLLADVIRDWGNGDKESINGSWRWGEMLRSESPQRRAVLTQPFYLGMHEVTQSQFTKVSGANPSYFSANGAGSATVSGVNTSEFPVESVIRDWGQCNHLSSIENLSLAYVPLDNIHIRGRGNGYRLPTECEWEFACRAGTVSNYWNGEKPDDLFSVGWVNGNSGASTHKVGMLPANPFGLYDMHGNVSEYVEDAFDKNAYKSTSEAPVVNPLCIHDLGPDKDMIRGGSFESPIFGCRSGFRGMSTGHVPWAAVGLRLALSVDGVRKSLNLQGPEIQHADNQILLKVLELGASIEVSFSLGGEDKHVKTLTEPRDVDLIGPTDFDIIAVSLQKNSSPDLAIKALTGITTIRSLYVADGWLSIEAFDAINSMTDLKDIFFNSCGYLDDARLLRLTQLEKLESAVFWYNGLGDLGLAHLNAFPNLRDVNLGGGRYDGSGLQSLSPMPNVKVITLTEGCLADVALDHLHRVFPNLQFLSLGHTKLSGQQLEKLKPLQHLTELGLHLLPLKDESLSGLNSFPNLKRINLWESGLSSLAIDAFADIHPHCSVISDAIPTKADSKGWWFNRDGHIKTDLKWDGVAPLTLEASIVPVNLGRQLIGNSTNGGSSSGGIGIWLNDDRWAIWMNTQHGWFEAVSDERVKLRSPSHLAGVFDGKELSLFINGKKSASVLVDAPAPSEHAFIVGANPDDSGNAREHFCGVMHGVRITNGALYKSDYTVPQKYEADSNTLLLLDFSDKQQEVIRDLSGKNVTVEPVGISRIDQN